MSEEARLPVVSLRRVFWLAAIAAAVAVPVALLRASDARAQSDQAPATEPTTPKKKTKSTKSKSKTKKTIPADTTVPAANPPAAPKQQ
jgi:hypothetical protein